MTTIVQVVMAKTGLDEGQAKLAVDAVVGFLKEKLPAPLASQIDGVLVSDVGGVVDQTESLLGGLFGKSDT